MSATFDRTEDFTEYFSDNLRDFIARYPDITERALENPRQLVSEAQTRMNAANARMIKARINKSPEEVTQPSGKKTKLPEELEHWNRQIEFFQEKTMLMDVESSIHYYIKFVQSPYNDHIRRFIDEDLPTCDTFDKFVRVVNLAHYNEIFDNYPLQCTCDAKQDTFQGCMYFGTDPKKHIFIACKGICSYGTKMTIANPEVHLKDRTFIDAYSEFNMDVVRA
jgi:hypothetical protein